MKIERMPQVLNRTGLSRTTLWRKVKAGDFPKPVKLTQKAIGWKSEDVDLWIESLLPS